METIIDFENQTKADWESGDLPCLLHMAGGNEKELVEIFNEVRPGDWIFSTHRNHYHALLAGVPVQVVREKINRGDSMFVYSREHNFFCSAILGGCCGIAAGVARMLKENKSSSRAWCFVGDGGEEQGKVYSAALSVEANDLPCTFIIEDNNRSVDTPRDVRRGSAKGLEHLFKCVRRYHYEPTYPHAGSGCKFQITFKPEAIERLKRGDAKCKSQTDTEDSNSSQRICSDVAPTVQPAGAARCPHVPPCFEKSDFCWSHEERKKRADALPNFP